MDIVKKNIIEVLQFSNHIIIPFYQRNYDWREKEVRQLINDIDSNNNDEYFLGTIIFKNKAFREKVIIDGQQRISTLFLILKSIYKNKYTNELIKQEITQILNFFKFKSFNSKDNDILNRIIEKDNDINGKIKLSRYWENYEYINKYFDRYASKINDFYLKLSKVIFSVITVDEYHDEHLIFSQINSTGKKLTAYDLFKNHLLSSIFSDSYNFDDSNISNYLLKLDIVTNFDTIKKNNNEQYILNLLRYYIAYESNMLAKKDSDDLYDAYLSLYNAIKDPEKIFQNFIIFGLCYRYVIDKKWKSTKFNDEMEMLYDSVNSYMNIIIDIIINNSSIECDNLVISLQNEMNIKESLKIIEIYKVRRMFCDLPEKTITRFIPTVSKTIKDIKGNYKYSEKLFWVLYHKANRDNYNYRMPTIDEFKRMFVTSKIYNTSNKFTKNILVRIAKYKNKVKINFDNFSVEHIMPNNLDKWYDSGFYEDINKIIDYKDTIGNLTITSYNSELSNNTFEEKKIFLKQKESLWLNNILLDYDEWNVDNIINRSNYLYKIIEEIYDINEIYNSSKNIDDYALDIETTFEDIDEETIDLFIKNKAYFKRIKKWDYEIIDKILCSYYDVHKSLVKTEIDVLGISFDGWISKIIINFYGLEVIKNQNYRIRYSDIKETVNNFDLKTKKILCLINSVVENRAIK